jgi:hypothetical protein
LLPFLIGDIEMRKKATKKKTNNMSIRKKATMSISEEIRHLETRLKELRATSNALEEEEEDGEERDISFNMSKTIIETYNVVLSGEELREFIEDYQEDVESWAEDNMDMCYFIEEYEEDYVFESWED